MHAPYHLSPRTQFVLRRGVVPWGLLAGIAAAVIAFGSAGEQVASSALRTLGLVIVCFAVWTGLIGWMVGGFLWEIRPPGERSRHRAAPRRAGNGDERK